MGVASLVIGIVALVLGFIPFCGMMAGLPALIGFVLGVVDVVLKSQKNEPRGQGIAGIVLNACAIGIIILWTMLFAAAAASG